MKKYRVKLLSFMLVLLIVTVFLFNPLFGGIPILAASNEIHLTSDYVLTSDITFSGSGFIIDADNIVLNLDGHTITGPGGTMYLGVRIDQHTGITVKNGSIQNFAFGVYLSNADSNVILNISSNNNYFHGIAVFKDSDNNQILRSSTDSNGSYGVYINNGSDGNIVNGGTMSNNYWHGVVIGGDGPTPDNLPSNYNMVRNVIFTNNDTGVKINNSDNNTLHGNTITNTPVAKWGIRILSGSDNNSVDNNTIINPQSDVSPPPTGILVDGTGNPCTNNSIIHNKISGGATGIGITFATSNRVVDNSINNIGIASKNTGVGLAIRSSTGNIFRYNSVTNCGYRGIGTSGSSSGNIIVNNNIINNATQVNVESGSSAVFNFPKTSGGGNYWSNWTSPDNNSDGFVDNPYMFPNGQDIFPWTGTNAWPDGLSPYTTNVVSGTMGNAGWFKSDLVVTLKSEDNFGGSGVKEIHYAVNSAPEVVINGTSTSFSINSDGNNTLVFYSKDYAGNVEPQRRVSLFVDKTPPVITPSIVPIPNTSGWNNTNVVISFTASDLISGVVYITGPVTVTSEGQNKKVTGTATDRAGNFNSLDVFLNIDKTPPVVSYIGNIGEYTVDQTVNIICSASDTLSGIASNTGYDIIGPAYTFSLGLNSFSAITTDRAGNSGSASTSFTVVVTYDSLTELVQRLVNKEGIANSLSAKLNAAKEAETLGDLNAKAGIIKAFINEVKAQADKSLSQDNASLLISLANALKT